MRVEIIMRDRVYNYTRGQVVTLEDGLFLRALLKGGKAEVLNPPDWYPGKEEENASKSSDKQSPDTKDSEQLSKNTKRAGKKSTNSIGESEGTSSEGHREPGEFFVFGENN